MAKRKSAKQSTKFKETSMEGKEYALLVGIAILAFVVGALVFSSTEVVEKEVPVLTPGEPTIVIVEKEVATDDPRVELVLNKQFEDYVDSVEENCLEALENEVDEEYFEDALVEAGIDVDEVRRFKVDEDDVKYTILSYDEEEDNEDKAEVEAEFTVRYTLNEGSTDVMKKKVVVSGVCEYDDGEPEFDLA
jgi:hypothetical protein